MQTREERLIAKIMSCGVDCDDAKGCLKGLLENIEYDVANEGRPRYAETISEMEGDGLDSDDLEDVMQLWQAGPHGQFDPPPEDEAAEVEEVIAPPPVAAVAVVTGFEGFD